MAQILKRTAALLRGSVRVQVESAFPERVLNLCSAHGIPFSDLTWESANAFSFSLSRGGARRLRELAAPLDAALSVRGRRGLPFAIGRLRRRRALLVGLLLCAALFLINTFFIWDLQVEGNETVRTERILRVLAQCGVRRGACVYSFRSQDVCNRALPELPELSWLTVNVSGCRAHIVVRERIPRPEIVNETKPTNVVARRDALVTEVRALDGEARVMRGATVTRGQLLIAGVVETRGADAPSIPTRYLAGKGEVWGRTWYELSVHIPLRTEEKRPTGEAKHRYALLFGEKRIKLYEKGSSNIGADCDKIQEQKQWTLFGFALPVCWQRETLLPYERVTRLRTRAEAEALGRTVLEGYLLAQLGADGSVTSAHCASAERDGWLLVTLSAECAEQIGVETPILIEDRDK